LLIRFTASASGGKLGGAQICHICHWKSECRTFATGNLTGLQEALGASAPSDVAAASAVTTVGADSIAAYLLPFAALSAANITDVACKVKTQASSQTQDQRLSSQSAHHHVCQLLPMTQQAAVAKCARQQRHCYL
jgi:hypothetical protein